MSLFVDGEEKYNPIESKKTAKKQTKLTVDDLENLALMKTLLQFNLILMPFLKILNSIPFVIFKSRFWGR